MTEPTRYQTAPVVLPLRLELEPVPVAGCDVCGALDRQRTEYRRLRDMTRVTDCNVELRQHPHGGAR
jgi:hypothetical protein